MGKGSKRRIRKKSGWKGWKLKTPDGHFLTKLFKTGKLSPAAMPALIRERYPQFRKYKEDSFSAGVRRLKGKLAVNTRRGNEENTGKYQ